MASGLEDLLRKRSQKAAPAALAGTSSMYLRARYLPKVLRERRLVVILGPKGVGKASVARRVLPSGSLTLRGDALHEACNRAVRRRAWPKEILEAPGLFIKEPTYLQRRHGVTRLLGQLIESRVDWGLTTVVSEGQDDSALLLLDAVEPGQGVTLNLRFPKRGGRMRFARARCEDLGLDPRLAARLEIEEPWTYLKVSRALYRIRRDREEG